MSNRLGIIMYDEWKDRYLFHEPLKEAEEEEEEEEAFFTFLGSGERS